MSGFAFVMVVCALALSVLIVIVSSDMSPSPPPYYALAVLVVFCLFSAEMAEWAAKDAGLMQVPPAECALP